LLPIRLLFSQRNYIAQFVPISLAEGCLSKSIIWR
jgi:hypothetical protein